MPLQTPNAPIACLAAFSSGLSVFLPGGPAGTVVSETFVGAVPAIPTSDDVSTSGGLPNITAALQTFVLSLTDAANNAGQISPAPAGWSIFSGDVNNKTVMGRMVQRQQGWKLVAVQYGEIVWETMNASRVLNSSPPPQLQAQDFEVRLLAIPALNLEFFWLVARNTGSVDLVFPTPAGVQPVTPMGTPSAPLEMPHFLAELRPLAASLLTMQAGYGA